MGIVKIFRVVNKLVFIRAKTRREKPFTQTRKVQNMMLWAISHFHTVLLFLIPIFGLCCK